MNDVVYITASIMGSIEGKSREYYAILAAVLVQSAQMGVKGGDCPRWLKMLYKTRPCIVRGELPARMRHYCSLRNVPVGVDVGESILTYRSPR